MEKKNNIKAKLMFGVVLLVLIIAAIMYFFPQLNPFKSTSTSSPSSSSNKPKDQNETQKQPEKDPEKKPEKETKQENPQEVIKAIRLLMLKMNYLTESEFRKFHAFTDASSVDEETLRQFVNTNFGGWNSFDRMSVLKLVVFGCTLLKKYTDEDLQVETREKYVDIVTKLIAMIDTDFLKTNDDIERNTYQNDSIVNTIDLFGRLLNMYQYVVDSKSNSRYYEAKVNCREYLDKLVPKLNYAIEKRQENTNMIFVTTPLLLSLFVMDYESYKKKITNEKTEFERFKSVISVVKDVRNSYWLNDHYYYRDVINEFISWQ